MLQVFSTYLLSVNPWQIVHKQVLRACGLITDKDTYLNDTQHTPCSHHTDIVFGSPGVVPPVPPCWTGRRGGGEPLRHAPESRWGSAQPAPPAAPGSLRRAGGCTGCRSPLDRRRTPHSAGRWTEAKRVWGRRHVDLLSFVRFITVFTWRLLPSYLQNYVHQKSTGGYCLPDPWRLYWTWKRTFNCTSSSAWNHITKLPESLGLVSLVAFQVILNEI